LGYRWIVELADSKEDFMKIESELTLTKVPYKKLSGKAKETYNFQKVSAMLVDYGFATNWLNVDFESADFIAAHFNGVDIIKVQLKSRITISKKYMGKGKDIYICFPLGDSFCLVSHNKLVQYIGKATDWLKSYSWRKNNGYSAAQPSKKLKELLAKHLL